MKTTIEISDGLAREARKVAAREKTTLRALVEAGLREVLKRRRDPAGFRLRDAAVQGRGLQPAVAGGGWDGIRDAAYEGRGG